MRGAHEELVQKLAEAEKARELLHTSRPTTEQFGETEAARKKAEEALAQLWKENEQLAKKASEGEKAAASAKRRESKARKSASNLRRWQRRGRARRMR